VFPVGTGNNFALDLGVKTVEDMFNVIDRGAVHAVDAVKVGGGGGAGGGGWGGGRGGVGGWAGGSKPTSSTRTRWIMRATSSTTFETLVYW